jgi:GAF domain-containing protein
LTRVYSETLAAESAEQPTGSLSAIEMYVADPSGIVLANSADPENTGFVLGALPEDIRATALAGAPLGAECPADKPECAPAERTPILPAEFVGLQPVGLAVANALSVNDVTSVRYCMPKDTAAAAGEDNCTQVWRVAAAAPVRASVGPEVAAPDDLFSVIVDTPEEAFLEAARRQRTLALWIAGLTALGAILGSLFLARALARPVNDIAHTARHIELGEPYHPEDLAAVTNRFDEIGSLARALTSMVAAQQARINELDMIYQVGRQVTASVDVDETLRFLADAIRPIIPYDAIEISVRQDAMSDLQRQYPAPENPEEPVRYDSSAGLISLAIAAPEGARVADLTQNPPPAGEPTRTWDGLPPRAWMGVPLQVKGQTLGVVELVGRLPDTFNEQAQRLLASISLQAAVAIQNASEVRERQQMYERQIMELNIEIDEMKRAQQVGEIVESEYFQNLSAQAQRMRSLRRREG